MATFETLKPLLREAYDRRWGEADSTNERIEHAFGADHGCTDRADVISAVV